jgi:hypothetical protein
MSINYKLYFKSSRLSSSKTRFPYNHRIETSEEVGIVIPSDAVGQASATCLECSSSRCKPQDRCFAVNAKVINQRGRADHATIQ